MRSRRSTGLATANESSNNPTRGVQLAIQCSYASPNTGWDFSGDDDGPMGAIGVEPRIEMAANSTAHMLFYNPPHNAIILYHFEQQM